MTKNDKELGNFIATAIVGVTSIKQFKRGFSIKKRGEIITKKIRFEKDTTYKDMAQIIGDTIKENNRN